MKLLKYLEENDTNLYIDLEDNFGTSDFMKDNYCLYNTGYLLDEFILTNIYERNLNSDEKYPLWLVESGESTVEYIGFDSIFTLISKLKDLKYSPLNSEEAVECVYCGKDRYKCNCEC